MNNTQLKFIFHLFTVCIFGLLIGCGNSDKPTTPAPVQQPTPKPSPSTTQVAPKSPDQEISTESSDEDSEEEIDFEDMDIEDVEEALVKYFNESKFELAKSAVQVLLEDDSEPLKYHFYSGKIYFELKQYGLAMDEFVHTTTELKETEEDEDELGFSSDDLDEYFKKAIDLSQDLKKKLPTIEGGKELADLVIVLLKLNPDIVFSDIKLKSGKKASRTYYIVKSLKYYQDVLKEDRSFWSYYKYSLLNFKMKWYSDANKNIDRALTLADTQAQIFFALMLQGQIQVVAPKGKQSELDKLSALDLTEDMLDEFLGKYSKTLNEKQMDKARVMMNKAMKLKAKLDKAEDDSSRLVLLKQFIADAEELLESKDFPPDITKKIASATKKSNKRMAELEEQIRIKQQVE
ncbi:MAG: hypothetical protein KC646_15805 [Candidatus Cloacimonetes bacterium]|nr:hypothetical protein [Candidatus Cloacimonadota bacterium]